MCNLIKKFNSIAIALLGVYAVLFSPLAIEHIYAVQVLDYNETTHLQFMREEEKLAHDVYATFANQYPQAKVFQNITESEQRHTSAVKNVLDYYEIPDPSISDFVGVFTGDEWGWYFTEKFSELVAMGSENLLSALYVGALIEELDMHDIAYCPEVIVEESEEIENLEECGYVYTDEEAIRGLYQYLLSGSENHLRAYVKNIEKIIGEGNYEAQYLTQEEVDDILGRGE